MTMQNHVNKNTGWRLRVGERRALLVFGDALAATLSLVAGAYLWAIAESTPLPLDQFFRERLEAWFFILPFVWLILLVDSYDNRRSSNWNKTLRSVAASTAIGFALYITLYFTAPPLSLP